MSLVSGLVCVRCGTKYREGQVDTCPACGRDEGILDVLFDVDCAAKTLTRVSLAERDRTHWRYAELLPLERESIPRNNPIGWTPIIEAPRLAKALGVGRLRLKNDGLNPSGSFKDR